MDIMWKIHTPRLFCIRPSLRLNRSTTLATSNAPTQPSPPNTLILQNNRINKRKQNPIHFCTASMDIMWKIHTPRLFCIRPSLPLNRSTTLATSNAPTQASPPNTLILQNNRINKRKQNPIHFCTASMDIMWKIHTPRLFCIRPSLPLNRSTTLATSNAPTQASPPNTRYAVQYLVQSCGLSSDEALKEARHIPHLKSPDNADAVICYFREIGLSDSDIRKVLLRDARILCSRVEKSLRPNITKLQEVGFSNEDISGIISANPTPFRFNIVSKIDFWMGVLESVENLSVVFKTRGVALFASSLENVVMPNISFLREHCGLSTRQIVRVIRQIPQLISSRPEYVKRVVERIDELGIDRSSVSFLEALITVSCVSESSIDAKLNNLRNIGFSQEEVAHLICKFPSMLGRSEKLVARKMEFLMKEAGCDKLHVIRNPFLFCCNLENRLIPRNIVRKLLMLKGIPVPKFASFAKPSDVKFVERFILPYEHVIPELRHAFADAGSTEAIN